MARLAAPDHQYVLGHDGFCSGLHFCLFSKEREKEGMELNG